MNVGFDGNLTSPVFSPTVANNNNNNDLLWAVLSLQIILIVILVGFTLILWGQKIQLQVNK